MQQPKRKIWTWQSPKSERYQLDYIMIRSRYRNTARNCHIYPGAYVNSDHNLVAANLKQVRYKKDQRCKEEAEMEPFYISE